MSGPWNSAEAGAEAFEEYLAANITSLPKISEFNLIQPSIELTGTQLKILEAISGRENQ